MEPKIQEKAWNPELESKVLKKWQESKIYDFVPSESNYTIDTPPPYPSGRPWHIGAAAHYSQIDMKTLFLDSSIFSFIGKIFQIYTHHSQDPVVFFLFRFRTY